MNETWQKSHCLWPKRSFHGSIVPTVSSRMKRFIALQMYVLILLGLCPPILRGHLALSYLLTSYLTPDAGCLPKRACRRCWIYCFGFVSSIGPHLKRSYGCTVTSRPACNGASCPYSPLHSQLQLLPLLAKGGWFASQLSPPSQTFQAHFSLNGCDGRPSPASALAPNTSSTKCSHPCFKVTSVGPKDPHTFLAL
jgi:hypothetical protein